MRRPRLRALACGLLVAARVAAQPAPPPPPLVAPKPVQRVEAEYPVGATASATVVLELLVLEDGSVGEVTVKDGAEPFNAAAIAAVKQYRFEPARRGDRVVRARIRAVVEFTPPKEVPSPEPPPEPEPVPPPLPGPEHLPSVAPTKPEPVEEVKIYGERQKPVTSPTEHRMARADVRLVPGAFGDPFRAIDALPGVVPTVSGLPFYYIRGAPPSAVGYFVDEVRVPYLFHFALGPGVIQPALIDEVSLHPAAFPARYGRYAGAIVAGRTRDPASEWYGEGNIRLFDLGAYVEAPLAKGRGSAGVGGRYSYTAGIFSLFAPDTTVDYRDYNLRASYRLDDHWRISTLGFGAYDFAKQKERDEKGQVVRDNVLFASEFHRLDVRLDRRGDDGSESRIAATLGIDRSRIVASRFAQDIVTAARARHRAPVDKDVDVEVGLDTTIDWYEGDLPSPFAVTEHDYQDAVAFFGPRIDTTTGVWVSGIWHPRRGPKGLELTATARVDLFTSDGVVKVGPSPRTSMRIPITPKLAFLGAMGVAPQTPAFAIPIPAITYARIPGGLGYGWQKSAGLEQQLPWRFLFRSVAFHHTYVDLRDLSRNTGDEALSDPQILTQSPTQAIGLEVYLSRRLSENIGAFLSYTLSRSAIGSTQFTPSRVSPFDRTHVFQIGSAVYIGRGWRASARFLTYRGWPDEGSDEKTIVPKDRLPPFFRVDARIEKRWDWRKTGYISLVIEALNASAQKETLSRECGPTGNCKDQEIGPIVAPSIGVEGAL